MAAAEKKAEKEGGEYKMDISVASKKGEQLILRIGGVSPAYKNTLRRTMTTEVPILAVEDVEFRKNSGALYDEQIAHRLGMLSIATDLKSYGLQKDCKCGGAGCAQCQVKMTLKAAGPKTVYAEEIKSQDPKATPVHGKMPITKLLEGQELELEATAVVGQGVEHVKWSPGLIHYKEYPHLSVKKQPANAKELASKYPEIVELKKDKLSIKEEGLINHDVHESLIAESEGTISVTYKDDYLLYIESWEQLSPKEIFVQALIEMDNTLDEIKKLAKKV